MSEEKNRMSIRSTAVNEIIAHKPSFLIRYGNLIFLLVLLLIISSSFLIRYPDVVPATARMLSGNSGSYAELFVPQDKFGKILPGQKVLLKLAAYPFREYGTIEGRVDSVIAGADSSGFTVKVSLVNGLTTNYRKQLTYRDGLAAEADIITADMRLSERLIKKIKSSF
jgi:multidrug efflux pump subunit AcrA (membrane-fusion protein)